MSVQTSHFVVALGREIHVEEFAPLTAPSTAPLPCVVCMHGLTRTWIDFETVARALAASGNRVLCPDFPGRGLSAWAPTPEDAEKEYGMRFYVPLFADVFKQMGVDRCVVLGQSMGGIWGWNAAATAMRGVIAKLVLIDVGPELALPGLVRISQYTTAASDAATMEELAAMCRARWSTMSPLPEATFFRVLINQSRRLPSGRWALHYDPAAPANLKNDCMDVVEPTERWVAFGQVECPILVVRGGASDLCTAEIVEKMRAAKRVGQLREVVVPDVGHVPLLQTPQEIEMIMQFVAST